MTDVFKKTLAALDARSFNDAAIHAAFCDMAETCRTMTKKTIVESEDLKKVFRHPQFARKSFLQAITWIENFTPLRVKFKDNGQFEKLSVKSGAKWQLVTMRKTAWFDFEPKKTKTAAAGDPDRALKALALELARVAHEKGSVANDLNRIREVLASEDFLTTIADAMKGEKFAQWAKSRDADMKKARAKDARAKADELKKEQEAAAAMKASIQDAKARLALVG
jgi:hypothetical protein